ncbi:MAG: PorV/PorQ family protein [bacterium]
MKRLSLTFLLILGIVLSFGNAYSQGGLNKIGQAGFKFLEVPVGAQISSLGRAGISIVDGPNAIFTNAAKTADITGIAAAFTHQEWLADINHNAGVVSAQIGNLGVLSATFVFVDYGDLVATTRSFSGDKAFEEIGTFSPSAYALGLGYSRTLTEKFSWGIHVRLAHMDFGNAVIGNDLTNPSAGSTIRDFSETAVVVDFGTVFNTGFEDLRIAMSLQNFSQELQVEEEFFPMPLSFKVGVAMDVLRFLSTSSADHSLTFEINVQAPRDFGLRTNFGGEYWYKDLLALRGGFIGNHDEADLSFGFGVRPKFGDTKVEIGYAYTNFGVFDNVQTFTIGFGF